MTYQRNPDGSLKRLTDGAVIPQDSRNVDFQEFLRWKAQGNTEAPEDPPLTPPVQTPRERLESRLGITVAQLKALLT